MAQVRTVTPPRPALRLRAECYPQHGMLELMFFRAVMVAFFILANSLFVAAEFALISVRETRMEQLVALGRPGARTALHLKRNIDEIGKASRREREQSPV